LGQIRSSRWKQKEGVVVVVRQDLRVDVLQIVVVFVFTFVFARSFHAEKSYVCAQTHSSCLWKPYPSPYRAE